MKKNQSNLNKTRNIVVTAILAAMSTALMFLNFSVPLMPGFIKLDLSELPALIGSFSMGPVYGVIVCLIKNLVNLLRTSTGGIGELSNFILGASFVFTAGLVYKYKKSRAGALIGSVLGALVMAGLSILSNYYVIYPIYENFMPLEAIMGMYKAIRPSTDSLLEALVVFNFPFTFVKGMLSAIITFVIYKHISPIIKGTYKK